MSNKVKEKNLNDIVKRARLLLTDKEYRDLMLRYDELIAKHEESEKKKVDFYKSIGLNENGEKIQSDCKNIKG